MLPLSRAAPAVVPAATMSLVAVSIIQYEMVNDAIDSILSLNNNGLSSVICAADAEAALTKRTRVIVRVPSTTLSSSRNAAAANAERFPAGGTAWTATRN